jgi:hypothetical protein
MQHWLPNLEHRRFGVKVVEVLRLEEEDQHPCGALPVCLVLVAEETRVKRYFKTRTSII